LFDSDVIKVLRKLEKEFEKEKNEILHSFTGEKA